MAHRLLSLPFFALFCLLFAVIPLSTAPVFASEQAVLPDGQAFLDLVEADLASGRLSAEEALLIRFQYGFAADKLPSRYEVAGFSPLRCATPLINEYYNLRSRLSKDTVELIDNWLRPSAAKMVHLSPSGRFSLTYDTSGADAVPVADVDPANGVPDYVENVALYFDEVWAVEIDTLGFAAPPLAGGTYAVSFESMQYYGYVAIVSPVPGATRIVMHNTFVGFPGNDDPAGTAVGAGKVTAAHEFKHATQYIATRWAEGGWSELDATWVEDVVFDEVNDYYHYLTGESPLREPAVPLDGGANTTGSYEDSVWQGWMTETWGVAAVQEFWVRRVAFLLEPVMVSYEAVLGARGVTLAEGWAAFSAWNYGVGIRAVPGLGYEEAAAYPEGPVVDTAVLYPSSTSGSVEHLAADFVRLEGFVETSTELLRVVFDGQDARGPLTLSVHIAKRDGTGLIETIALDAANNANHLISVPARDILTAGVIVGNSALVGLAGDWDLDLELVPIPAIPAAAVSHPALARTLVVGELSQEIVRLSNIGEVGSLLEFEARLWTTHPDSGLMAKGGARAVDKSVAGSTLTCTSALYLPGQLVNLDFVAHNGSSDDEWLTGLSLDFPAGVSILISSNFTGGSLGDLATDNALGDGALIDWFGVYGAQNYGVLRDGETAYGSVQVLIDPDFFGDLDIGWTLAGDSFGGTPHQIAGTLTLAEDNPLLALQSPNGGEVHAAGDSLTVTWSTGGTVPTVDLELSRDGGATWSVLLSGLANNGSHRVLVAGPPTNHAQLRIEATSGSAADTSNGTFHIYTSPTWVAATPDSGGLMDTEFVDLVLALNATELLPGSYEAWLVVRHSAPDARLVVPISLLVEPDPSTVGPRHEFALRGAHPNPFNPRTTISFELPAAAETTVDVLDVRGRLVRRLLQGELAAGAHQQMWDGQDNGGRSVSAGVYLVRVRAGSHTGTTKVLLAK